ncbi:hypothetical protein [Limimaricola soesokkakensis]|uniref:hypothetical protein n=1 Tax=Limimaricola soesokkakensis TaxID=1343159 RepID=UPI0010550F4E|nr:hypothetical protein [Limimaricola soesokkakensis]
MELSINAGGKTDCASGMTMVAWEERVMEGNFHIGHYRPTELPIRPHPASIYSSLKLVHCHRHTGLHRGDRLDNNSLLEVGPVALQLQTGEISR